MGTHRHDRQARCSKPPMASETCRPAPRQPTLDAMVQLVYAGLRATTSSPRRSSSPGHSLTMTSWGGCHIGIHRPSGSTGGSGIAAARPHGEGRMAVITRGFGGGRRDDTDLPPGQYRTDDFPMMWALRIRSIVANPDDANVSDVGYAIVRGGILLPLHPT